MRDLLEHVEQAIRRHCALVDRQRILVAVSGGLDSQVLLHLLHRLAPARGWRLVVAHFNHGLRGRASDADEALVRRTAARLKLPCLVGRGRAQKLADEEGVSVEMAARRLRHEFLARAAGRRRCPVVALAHHADDQVELFFLRLLRGAGAEGLAGMGWTSPSPTEPGLRLVRPLLDVPKSALRAFAEVARVPFREDRSNASCEVLRNRLRHEVLPLLKRTCQPALERVILRQMDILDAEARHLAAEARAWLERRRPSFDRLSTALQRHCLRLQLLGLGARPDFDWIEQLRQTPLRGVTIRPGLVIARDTDGTLRARAAPASCSRPVEGAPPLVLNLARFPRRTLFGSVAISWDLRRGRGPRGPGSEGRGESFDADCVGPVVQLRHWRPGDRFQPIGMGRPVKLQDLFVNAKIPRGRRHELIVATTASGEIWWVEGLRIGEKFKITPATVRRLHWRWCRSA